jgi:hypothetical protein
MPRPRTLQLVLQVALDRVPDLRSPDIVAHTADFLAKAHGAAVVEADGLEARFGVDLRN